MNARRAWFVLVGSIGLLATGAVIIDPSAESALPFERAAMDYIVVGLLGFAIVLSATILFGIRAITHVREYRPPPVESRDRYHPGGKTDAALEDLPLFRVTGKHHELHTQLRELAISAIAHRHHCSRSAAIDRLQDGTWTDDPLADDFLQQDSLTPPSIPTRCRSLITGNHWYRDRICAAVRELEQIEGIEN